MTRRRLAGWAMILGPCAVWLAGLLVLAGDVRVALLALAITVGVMSAVPITVWLLIEGWLRLHE